uniref:Uncharacterized protein n=1 Tax=Grammatophora oceanica TaxID=210454 RepID=A0A7S1YEH6_9STRA
MNTVYTLIIFQQHHPTDSLRTAGDPLDSSIFAKWNTLYAINISSNVYVPLGFSLVVGLFPPRSVSLSSSSQMCIPGPSSVAVVADGIDDGSVAFASRETTLGKE